MLYCYITQTWLLLARSPKLGGKRAARKCGRIGTEDECACWVVGPREKNVSACMANNRRTVQSHLRALAVSTDRRTLHERREGPQALVLAVRWSWQTWRSAGCRSVKYAFRMDVFARRTRELFMLENKAFHSALARLYNIQSSQESCVAHRTQSARLLSRCAHVCECEPTLHKPSTLPVVH